MDSDRWIIEFRFREDPLVYSEVFDQRPESNRAIEYGLLWKPVSESWFTGVPTVKGPMRLRSLEKVVENLPNVKSVMSDYYIFRVVNKETDEDILVDVLI